jgi:hypothetical protein
MPRVADRLGFAVYAEQKRFRQRLDKRLLQHGHMAASDIDESKVLG